MMFEGGGRSPSEGAASRCIQHRNTSRKGSGCRGSVLNRRVERESFGTKYETRIWLCERHYPAGPRPPHLMPYLGPAQPGTGIALVCRCGEWMFLGYHGTGVWAPLPKGMAWDAGQFRKEHQGDGHRLDRDDYRAACRPPGGCRNCGAAPQWPKHFYCSDACKEEFEREHFWGTARLATYARQTVYDIETHGRSGTVCTRCEQTGRGPLEVNHIRPVAGRRYPFGCQHHGANLEALCHECHVAVTAEQRAAGLI